MRSDPSQESGPPLLNMDGVMFSVLCSVSPGPHTKEREKAFQICICPFEKPPVGFDRQKDSFEG